MIYNSYKDIKISALGMGAMRLPIISGDDAKIDVSAAESMVDYAYKNGINYFDTAWGYHGGNSELIMGEALKKYPRESYYLADKFPGYDKANWTKVEEIFEKQLKKCQVNYFDFYLYHNVCEMNIDAYLNPDYHIFDYLIKQKNEGRIKHLGFSTHGELPVMERFLQAHGKDMEFCQIQLNYLDWDFQKAKDKIALLNEYNIPVWVMEPLRGGRLAKLNVDEMGRLKTMRPDFTAIEWAFNYLLTFKQVNVILSGMSSLEQMKENVAVFNNPKPLNNEEIKTIYELAKEMTGKKTLPCTACKYCVDHCPKGLDIPSLLALYNENNFTDGGFRAPMTLMAYDKEKRPSACLKCHNCESVCPQKIKISDYLSELNEKTAKILDFLDK